ncbi:MAG: hypothetical protein IT350_19105 [Deltaproteobacteria bacterium]|nr:hypothetical protein [Deltaproteobacteria bacterium]
MNAARETALKDIRNRVFSLDEDGLWDLVVSLFPDAAEETREDIYDALLSAARKENLARSADDVFAEEDRRRGITR